VNEMVTEIDKKTDLVMLTTRPESAMARRIERERRIKIDRIEDTKKTETEIEKRIEKRITRKRNVTRKVSSIKKIPLVTTRKKKRRKDIARVNIPKTIAVIIMARLTELSAAVASFHPVKTVIFIVRVRVPKKNERTDTVIVD